MQSFFIFNMFNKVLKQITVISVVLVTGCGEENYRVGVTVGGSGSGQNTGTGSTPPLLSDPISPLPSTGDENEMQDRFVVWTPVNNMHYCAPLEISFHLVNKTTNEILPDGYGTDLSYIEPNDLHNLHLQAHIKNLSSETIYQYNHDCKSGFTLQDQNLIPFNENIEVSCTQNQSLQIYKPYEEKIFDLKYNLPFKDQTWTISYRTFFSINRVVNRPDSQTCEAREISLKIEEM